MSSAVSSSSTSARTATPTAASSSSASRMASTAAASSTASTASVSSARSSSTATSSTASSASPSSLAESTSFTAVAAAATDAGDKIPSPSSGSDSHSSPVDAAGRSSTGGLPPVGVGLVSAAAALIALFILYRIYRWRRQRKIAAAAEAARVDSDDYDWVPPIPPTLPPSQSSASSTLNPPEMRRASMPLSYPSPALVSYEHHRRRSTGASEALLSLPRSSSRGGTPGSSNASSDEGFADSNSFASYSSPGTRRGAPHSPHSRIEIVTPQPLAPEAYPQGYPRWEGAGTRRAGSWRGPPPSHAWQGEGERPSRLGRPHGVSESGHGPPAMGREDL